MCGNLNRWNKEKMQEYCNENAIGYIVLEEKFIDKGYQIQQFALMSCDNDEHEPYWVWWNHFTHNRRCPKCKNKKLSDKFKTDISTVKDIFNSFGYNLIDETKYTNVDSCVECIDNKGFKYRTSVTSLRKNGKVSSKFDTKNPFSIDNIKLFCRLFRDDYELISDIYTNIKDNYIWKYKGDFYDNIEHFRYFKCSADCFINGFVKHPDLSMSKLEIKMRKILEKYNVNYVTQKTFDGCVDKNKLRFDFYMCDFNICIETDGKQHEIPVEIWGGQDALNEIIRRDTIKNVFCEENKIPLIRIPQSKINRMEEILLSELNKLNINIAERSLL